MGLWSAIKSLFGVKEDEKQYPSYSQPVVLSPKVQQDDRAHWDQMKQRWNKRMEWERQRRSKYGGG